MEINNYQTNSINVVFGDFDLVLYILSFLYNKTNHPSEFLTNTPIALHLLSFKSLYYEFHKIPNLQIKSLPIQYLSSFQPQVYSVEYQQQHRDRNLMDFLSATRILCANLPVSTE
jgi:hypothetical protein